MSDGGLHSDRSRREEDETKKRVKRERRLRIGWSVRVAGGERELLLPLLSSPMGSRSQALSERAKERRNERPPRLEREKKEK